MMPKSKICTKCKVEKALEEFHRRKEGKFGRQSHCKVCIAEWRAANHGILSEKRRIYYQENRERLVGQMRRYRDENREILNAQKHQYNKENRKKISEKKRLYYQENRGRISERKRLYYQENRGRISEQKRQHYEANRERYCAKQRQYYEANIEQRKAYNRQWNETNPEKSAALKAKRRAAKLNRTPSWSDLEHIKLFYDARRAISEATGRLFHVDHMIPLQGKTVSGLHVPGNLQIIPAERNLSKNNSF